MKKFIMSYSCGKDSTLALYRMIKNGNTPVALLVTVNKEENRSWFHGIPENLIKEVSKSLDIPLILVETKGNDYESKFTETLIKAKDTLGIDSCVFGDIDLEPHREWCTARKNVKLECMGEDFLGKILTREVVKDIKETGSDACGENGEYHTFVYDGPIFKYPIKFQHLNIIKNETHGFLDVKEFENE